LLEVPKWTKDGSRLQAELNVTLVRESLKAVDIIHQIAGIQ